MQRTKTQINLSILATLIFSLAMLRLTAQSYQAAESVEYDATNNRWLVSNGSSIIVDDGAGNLTFFGNASANYGVEVMGDVVYGISGNQIKGYDLTTAEEVTSATIAGAGFLNGLTNDGNNILYATDFGNDRIYRIDMSDLSNPLVGTLVSDTESTPNGIVFDETNNRLIFVNWGGNAPIKAVDLATNQVSTITSTMLANIDGIDEDSNGNYYIASWTPARITKYDATFTTSETITTPFLNAPADIGYAKETDILGIPIGNSVIFVDLSEAVSISLSPSRLDYAVSPNPINHQSTIKFNLPQKGNVDLGLFNQHGQLVKQLLAGPQAAGDHHILFTGHDLVPGIYYSRLFYNEKLSVLKLVVL